MRKRTLLRWLGLYPPFLGAGIHVTRVSTDLLTFEVELRQHWWNRNYFGTHFGGSLYAMVDPFFALILAEALGAEYVVWDKAASIEFKKPGRGTVRAVFRVSPDEVAAIRRQADGGGKVEPEFSVDVVDAGGNVVASARKLLHVRRKDLGRQRKTGDAA